MNYINLILLIFVQMKSLQDLFIDKITRETIGLTHSQLEFFPW